MVLAEHTSRHRFEIDLAKFAVPTQLCDAAVGAGAVKPHADGTPRSRTATRRVDEPAVGRERHLLPDWFVVNIVRGITMVIFVLTMFVVYMAVTSTFNHLIKAPVLVVHTRVTLPAGAHSGWWPRRGGRRRRRCRRRQEGGVILSRRARPPVCQCDPGI